MTKRIFNTENRTTTNKKPKLDNEIEALWGDEELDESVFDDCIRFDSQVVQEEPRNENESILPNYTIFKAPRQMLSSTQLEVHATTSKLSNYDETHKKSSIEFEIQKLKVQCKEKDGEVAVLRSQLRDIRAQSNVDFQKSQAEWKSKFTNTEKQIQAVKSELEFKNLEIANLRQKVLSLSKANVNITVNNDSTKSPKPLPKIQSEEKQKDLCSKLCITSLTDYPLQGVVNESMVSILKNEKFVLENKQIHSYKNAIPYLQNKNISTRVILDKNRADIQLIYPILLKFCEYRIEEIDCSKNIKDISKIVCTTLQLLDDLYILLHEIKRNLRTEDILEADSVYLKRINCVSEFDGSNKNELGKKSSFLLNFLSELLPYSTYLKDYFFENKQLVLKELENFRSSLPYISSKRIHTGEDFLNKLISVLSMLGEIRKTNVMSSFLKSTIYLLTNICKLKGYENLENLICLSTKELIFLRPSLETAFQLTYLLREASRYTYFVQFLLNKAKNDGITKNKKVIYFNKDACRFYIFVLIFDRCLSKKRNVPSEICFNILSFIYNTYKSSYFIHHQDIKECECLPQLYKLVIEIIHRTVERCLDENSDIGGKGEPVNFFESKIILKVLNLMTFNCYELTAKYITVYSQFKDIERRFREKGVCDLDRMNINEEIPEIDSHNFDNIGF
ncbi:unnamed protein product [Diabrotica balteata]|uniref:ATR-interacting protein n=1 Tax=Diabrotica balteata TaxID=107213 RepID=A0A9N9T4H2_DIABA|nr:unnamed protein product [Diabrotica balteata]